MIVSPSARCFALVVALVGALVAGLSACGGGAQSPDLGVVDESSAPNSPTPTLPTPEESEAEGVVPADVMALGSFSISADYQVTFRDDTGDAIVLDDATGLVIAPATDAAYVARFQVESGDLAIETLPDGGTALVAGGELVLTIASLDPTGETLARDLATGVGADLPASRGTPADWRATATTTGYDVTADVPAEAGRLVALWGTATVAGARWRDLGEGGESLAVTPTALGRLAISAPNRFAPGELAALEPAAGTDVMDKQLRCHILGARSKATWNLEPWRPDVDYAAYLLARCNP